MYLKLYEEKCSRIQRGEAKGKKKWWWGIYERIKDTGDMVRFNIILVGILEGEERE